MNKYETPECNYNIPAAKLIDILQDLTNPSVVKSTDRMDPFGPPGPTGPSEPFFNKKVLENLFTSLRNYEDYSVLNPPKLEMKRSSSVSQLKRKEVHQTAPPFEEKIVNALFWIPGVNNDSRAKIENKPGKYKYLKIKLAPSKIKAAGIGAYAVDSIPKGARGVYKGVALSEKNANMYYSWTVKSFDSNTGEPDEKDKPRYFIDATNLETSNWTRYVNCGIKKKFNNFDSDQLYDKFFYVSIRNIKKGEELLIDYGLEYRQDNLGMKEKY